MSDWIKDVDGWKKTSGKGLTDTDYDAIAEKVVEKLGKAEDEEY